MGDASDTARLRISAEQGINRVEAASLSEFISELDEPSQLDNFSLWFTDSDRRVHLRLSAILGRVSLSVSGPSETWVRGRFDELAHKLSRTRRKFAYSQDVVWWGLIGVWVVACIALGLSVADKQALTSGYLGAGAVVLALGVPLWRRTKSKVQLTASQATSSGMTVFNVVISVLSVLLAVASLWVGWAAWQHPVK
ncbi:hypothetical protein [Streptomyces sp. 1222.5]|uniref:hypothetical protein n=1 Tax=Streptomyces sp. 1222.5 TaxID=1881026 RepID=UPI003D74D027